MLAHLLYIATFCALTLAVPTGILSSSGALVISLGAIGLWRYLWALTNFSRALFYIHVAYPHRRRQAEAAYVRRERPAHAFLLIKSYKV